MLKNLKNNKSAQFIAGAATIWFAWVLYRDGWLDLFFREKPDGDGFASPAEWAAIGATLLAAAVNFVQFVGICTLGVLSGLLPHAEDGLRWLSQVAKKFAVWARQAISEWQSSEKVEGQWNWKPLAAVVLASVLWTGGHIGSIWDAIVDAVPNVVEDLPRGESDGRPVSDERDGRTRGIDLTPQPKDRTGSVGPKDRTQAVLDDTRSSDSRTVGQGSNQKGERRGGGLLGLRKRR